MELIIENPADYINKVVDFRRSVFDKIASKNRDQIWLERSLKDVKRVVLINSAPRSGSSLLFAILRKIPQIYSLSGESVPFYKLNGLSSDSFPSDKIPDELMRTVDNNFNMARDFLSDLSIMNRQDDSTDDSDLLNQYIDDLILRFSIQWPKISFSYDIFRKLAIWALDIYLKAHNRFSKEEFYLELFKLLRSEYHDINPYYYDIPQDSVKKEFPDSEVPSGPPNNILMIEEPPFILLSPGKKLSVEDLFEKILLLKSPVNCYRMNYITSIFPDADIRVIHLTRNPAASINSLYDGWLHRGFFSHNLQSFFRYNKGGKLDRLKIAGYSDKYLWGKWWWNYGLPPGWQDYAEKRLEEVCAFQWCCANKTIQEYISYNKIKFCQVRYENIVRNLKSRVGEINKILDFIGIRHDIIGDLSLDQVPVIQATQPPQPYRWHKRKGVLLSLLDNPEISQMCGHLGYDEGSLEEWL